MSATRSDRGGERCPTPSLFDELGGEPVLRAIVERFVQRIFDDPMIGFFFRKANRRRVADKEYELAAQHLGSGGEYTGRPLRQAHAPHPIMGGQFDRRLTILRETLLEAGAPASVIEHWLAYTESQRALVTRDAHGQCMGPSLPGSAVVDAAAVSDAAASGAAASGLTDEAAPTPLRSSRKASDP